MRRDRDCTGATLVSRELSSGEITLRGHSRNRRLPRPGVAQARWPHESIRVQFASFKQFFFNPGR